MKVAGEGIYGTRPVTSDVAEPSRGPWSRWTQKGQPGLGLGRRIRADAATGPARLPLSSAPPLWPGAAGDRSAQDGRVLVDLPPGPRTGPAVVSFDLLGGLLTAV